MKSSLNLAVLLLAIGVASSRAQQSTQAQRPPKQPPVPAVSNLPATQKPATERIETFPASKELRIGATETGYMDAAHLKNLLHRIWLAEYRINDLLAQVHPERWKTSDAARKSFGLTLENLRKALDAQEGWRAQFEKRLDSMYLGYETYTAMAAVLPRLDGVARSVSQYENPSFGAQYSQAGNQLFDLQQALQPYLSFLLRNQDQLLLAAQSNLASCQNQLGFAMRGHTEAAKPMKNVLPNFKGRRRMRRAAEVPGNAGSGQRVGKPAGEEGEKQSRAKDAVSSKSKSATPTAKPSPEK